jgi:hypothetical protein
VRWLIRSAGAKLFFLPKYSPNPKPIEQLFARLKHSYARPPHELSTLFAWPSARSFKPRAWLADHLVINAFFGASSGDHSLNEVFRKNSDPVLEPTVSLE